jgi:REP element-mobilizing transposase RayT
MFDRRSYRLKGHDYSFPGFYFITICTNRNECSFGRIIENKMILNAIGKIANDFWVEIPKHFPNAILHEFIIMPNHLHGIIELIRINEYINQNHGENAISCNGGTGNGGTRHGATLHSNDAKLNNNKSNQNQFGKPVAGSVSVIINQYKSSVKRWCNKNNYQYFKWQSRFYERLIRNKKSFIAISNYIKKNPARWKAWQ